MARQVSPLDVRDTLAVQDRLPTLRVPACVVWGVADQFQKFAYGGRVRSGPPHHGPADRGRQALHARGPPGRRRGRRSAVWPLRSARRAGPDPPGDGASVPVDAVDDRAVEPRLPRQPHPVQAGDRRGTRGVDGGTVRVGRTGDVQPPGVRAEAGAPQHRRAPAGRCRRRAAARSPSAATTRCGTHGRRPAARARAAAVRRSRHRGAGRSRATRLSASAFSTPVSQSHQYRSTPSTEIGRYQGGPAALTTVTRCVADSSTASCAAELPPPTTTTSPGGTSCGDA